MSAKERPILFTGPMVRAILEGRKTQTRRVVKDQPPDGFTLPCHTFEGGWTFENKVMNVWPHEWRGITCPFGKSGDRLWVRETFCIGRHKGQEDEVIYRADLKQGDVLNGNWSPSIFMPRWISRLTLEITDIRVQRVQEITEEDAKAEGIDQLEGMRPYGWTHILAAEPADGPFETFESASEAFFRLWDSINAKRGFGWKVNPWVWALTFKVVPR